METARYLDLLDRLHAAALTPPFASAEDRSSRSDRKLRREWREVWSALSTEKVTRWLRTA